MMLLAPYFLTAWRYFYLAAAALSGLFVTSKLKKSETVVNPSLAFRPAFFLLLFLPPAVQGVKSAKSLAAFALFAHREAIHKVLFAVTASDPPQGLLIAWPLATSTDHGPPRQHEKYFHS
jgi:hypothetical protein